MAAHLFLDNAGVESVVFPLLRGRTLCCNQRAISSCPLCEGLLLSPGDLVLFRFEGCQLTHSKSASFLWCVVPKCVGRLRKESASGQGSLLTEAQAYQDVVVSRHEGFRTAPDSTNLISNDNRKPMSKVLIRH